MTDRNALFIGGSSLDILLKVNRLPGSGEKLVADFTGHQAGGMVANAACAASRLGMKVSWVGELGSDEAGRLLIDSFDEFGVCTSHVKFRNEPATDFTVVLLEPSGERTIFVVPTSLGPPDLSTEALSLAGKSSVVYTLPQPMDWFGNLADIVHEGGGVVAVDIEASSPVHGDELCSVLKRSEIVFCSRDGLEIASGTRDIEAGCSQVMELGPNCVCVTLGSGGAYAVSPDHEVYSPGFDVPVVDTTGAGDCFHAAFLCQLMKGESLSRALRFANAAAALSVRALGPRGGIPTSADVENFLDVWNHTSGSE